MKLGSVELIEKAKKLIDRHYSSAHQVGAVLQSTDGQLFESISMQGQKLHICAEWPALAQALMAKAEIEMAVAVYKDKQGEYEVFSPCSLCRDLYLKYFPEVKVIVNETEVLSARDLLPYAWERRK